MSETKYGDRKVLFGVIKKPDGRIEVRVYHANVSEREVVKAHSANPRYFIEHYGTYSHSKIRAKYWLAQAVSEYRSHFASNRVDFVLV